MDSLRKLADDMRQDGRRPYGEREAAQAALNAFASRLSALLDAPEAGGVLVKRKVYVLSDPERRHRGIVVVNMDDVGPATLVDVEVRAVATGETGKDDK